MRAKNRRAPFWPIRSRADRRRKTDAARRAGDDSYPPFQLAHDDFSFSFFRDYASPEGADAAARTAGRLGP